MPVLGGRSSTSAALLFYGRLYFNISTLRQINGPVISAHYPHLDGGENGQIPVRRRDGSSFLFFFFFSLLKYCSVGSFLFQLIDNDFEFFSLSKD